MSSPLPFSFFINKGWDSIFCVWPLTALCLRDEDLAPEEESGSQKAVEACQTETRKKNGALGREIRGTKPTGVHVHITCSGMVAERGSLSLCSDFSN